MNSIALMQLMKKIKPPDPYSSEGFNPPEPDTPDSSDKLADVDPLESEGAAFRNLREHTSTAPDPKDYKPSLGRNIAAALLAGAQGFTGGAEKGIALGQSIKNAPFDEAQSDWARNQKTLGDLTALEEKDESRRGSLFEHKQASKDKQTALTERMQDRDLTRQGLEAERQRQEANRQADNQRADTALTQAEKDRAAGRADRKAMHEDVMALGNRNATNAEQKTRVASGNTQKNLELKTKKQYEAEMKPIRDQEESFAKVQGLGKTATGPADIALLMQFVHGIDNTAAREGEVRTAQSAQSLGDRINTYIENLKTGRKLDPKVVQQFVDAAKTLHDSYAGPRKKQIQDTYNDIVQGYGLDAHHVMSDYSPSVSSPNSEWDAEFNKKYGQKK